VTALILRSKVDCEDFVRGCTFLGTGGGGKPEVGLQLLYDDLKRFKEIEITDPSSIPDESWTCCPFLMGSIAPPTEETKDRIKQLDLRMIENPDRILAYAVQELENYSDRKIEALVPIELGGGNTPSGIDAALTLGIKVTNGDYTGRAIPEIEQTTPYLLNKPIFPIASVDQYGSVCFIKKAPNYEMAEIIGKQISVGGFGLAGQTGFLMKGKEMKQTIIPNTLSECYGIGKTIREARESGDDPVKAVTEHIKGWVLFTGEVVKKSWEDKRGYMIGEHVINGIGDFEDKRLKVWYENENHVTWIDDKPYVTSPDIIEIVDLKTAEPITNTLVKEGNEVAVIGAKRRKEFATEKAIEILGPKHFGFNIEYIPIEKILS
jgi:DUF917 family protein